MEPNNYASIEQYFDELNFEEEDSRLLVVILRQSSKQLAGIHDALIRLEAALRVIGCADAGACKVNEHEKDWANSAFGNVYAALALADLLEPGDSLVNWLNCNGFANLTCCPACHVGDFTHVKGCAVSAAIRPGSPYRPGLAGGGRRGD